MKIYIPMMIAYNKELIFVLPQHIQNSFLLFLDVFVIITDLPPCNIMVSTFSADITI